MSSTNKTPNYALPQFIPTDKPTWLGDVNSAMLAIDTAMADNHTTAETANTSASAAVAQVQHAVDTANEAKVDSAAALQNATNAIGVAQNALNSATSATQTAQAATQTANAANASAASAVATANQAKQTADATDAELTEFEHAFSAFVDSLIDKGLSYLVISPAGFGLARRAPITITETPYPIWKFNSQLFLVGDPLKISVEDNIYLQVMPLAEDNTQTINIATNSGSVTTNDLLAISFSDTYETYKRITSNNPPTNRSAKKTGPFLLSCIH